MILLPCSTVQAGYHRLLWHFLGETLLPCVIGCQAQPSQTHTKKCRQGKTGRGVPIARQTDWAPIRMREQDKELPPPRSSHLSHPLHSRARVFPFFCTPILSVASNELGHSSDRESHTRALRDLRESSTRTSQSSARNPARNAVVK